MNISEVKVRLNESDIISIVNDFTKVKGLNIEDVKISDELILKGKFKTIITIPFKVAVEVVGVQANKLTVRLKSLKIMKIRIFKFIRNIALKLILKEIRDKGIISKGDCIEIALDKILNPIPFLNLNLNSVSLEGGYLQVTVSEIDFKLSKLGDKVESIEIVKEDDNKDIDIKNIKVDKVDDLYTEGRGFTENNMPVNIKKYSDYIFIIPDIIALIYRLMKDKRVDNKTKAIIGGTVAYVSFPVDILPDNVPFIGKIDDVGVIFFALNRIIEDIPIEIILENWQGKNEFVVVLKKSLEYFTKFTAAGNVDKIYKLIDYMITT